MILFNHITLQVHRLPLLEQANLTVQAGEKVVIRGPSGSGKSSLLKAVVGALPLNSGSIHIDDIQLAAPTVSAIRGRIAYIGQEPVLGAETVREALLLPFTYKAHRHHMPDEKRICTDLERLHLQQDILNKPCKRISGGEKQRIAILRALLLDKTIFLADEVTSALDPESRRAVMNALFLPGITLLSVSHDPEWIRSCSRVVEISDQHLMEVSS